MTTTLDLVPLGVFVALSPIPVVAILLVLSGRRPLLNGLAFTVGWLAAILVVAGVAVLVFADRDFSRGTAPSTAASAFRILAGGVLVGIGLRAARRPAAAPAAPPAWMDRLARLRPAAALAAGAGVLLVNVGDVFAVLAAATNILQAGLTGAESLAALFVFALLASLSLLLPLAAFAVAPTRSADRLDRAKRWLSAPQNTSVALSLLVGAFLVVGGIRGLTG